MSIKNILLMDANNIIWMNTGYIHFMNTEDIQITLYEYYIHYYCEQYNSTLI